MSGRRCTVPGVMVEVDGLGLLITGPAGIGKSELGLALIGSGHRLVADDVVELRRRGDRLLALRSAQYAGFVWLRDLGVVNVIKLYGAAASVERQQLDLVLVLEPADGHTASEIADLGGRRDSQHILGVRVPRVRLTSTPGRPLHRLAETAARDQQLRNRGYHAGRDFEARQQRQLRDNTAWS